MTQQLIKQPKIIQAKHHTLSYEEKTLVMGILNVTRTLFQMEENSIKWIKRWLMQRSS